jgi:hypothetical protein
VTIVRVEKFKWNPEMSNWLVQQIEVGKYGMLKDSLSPELTHFEYVFFDDKDALVFALTFNI